MNGASKPYFLLSFLPAVAYWYLETYYTLEVALIGGILLGVIEMVLEKKFTGHPQFEYYKNQFKNYLAFKAEEADLEQNKVTILQSIYKENVVRPHTFLVKKAD